MPSSRRRDAVSGGDGRNVTVTGQAGVSLLPCALTVHWEPQDLSLCPLELLGRGKPDMGAAERMNLGVPSLAR